MSIASLYFCKSSKTAEIKYQEVLNNSQAVNNNRLTFLRAEVHYLIIVPIPLLERCFAVLAVR